MIDHAAEFVRLCGVFIAATDRAAEMDSMDSMDSMDRRCSESGSGRGNDRPQDETAVGTTTKGECTR
jgi:hypothetical protein